MFKLVKSETLDLTPDLAKEFSSMEASFTERDLNEAHVSHLLAKAETQRLITFQWAVTTIDELQGRKVRMNGQHSSTMLTRLNGSFPKGLKVHMDEYHCETVDDAQLLFRQFDDKKSVRTSFDVSAVYQRKYEALRDLDPGTVKTAVEAVAWFRKSIEKSDNPKGDDQYQYIHDLTLHPFYQWFAGMFATSKLGHLNRKGVTGAMFGTFLANPEQAKVFWAEVKNGGKEFEDNAPTTMLDKTLDQIKAQKTAKTIGSQKKFFFGCGYAWNAFRADKKINSIRWDKEITLAE